MSPRPRDEPSSLSAVSASSFNSTSGAFSAGIGVGVGITVAGMILLSVAVVVFIHRRKRRRPDPEPPTPVAEISSNMPLEPSPDPAPPTPVAETNSNMPLEPLLCPQLTGLAAIPFKCRLRGDNGLDIKRELPTQGCMIRNHVKNNYHLDPVLVEPGTLHASLCQLQLSEGTCRTVVRLSIDPRTRHVAIRHLLALVIFSNIDTHSVGSLSLLPPVLKELFKSRVEADRESQDPSVETALVGWNQLTAFLLHKNPKTSELLPLLPSVESQIKTLATLLQGFLAHFALTNHDGSHGTQQGRLEYIIKDCARLGYGIFSDAHDWRLTFPQQEKGVVVLPGLESHSDGNVGELYDSPVIALAPEVVAVDLMDD